MIAEVPDGPPVRFRWRHVLHQVARAEGPERIAMEWWRDDRGNKLTRDYFRVESRRGARVWLYREGLYGRETSRSRAGICTGCLRDVVVESHPLLRMPSWPSPPTFPFCAALRPPKSWSLRAKELGLVGLGIADRNSRRRRCARARDGEGSIGLQDRRRRAPRLHRRHARHSRLSAGSRRPGAGSRGCSRSASVAPRRATAFSACRISWMISQGLNLIVMPPRADPCRRAGQSACAA